MTLSYTTPPSPTAPLACDCLGAVVYIKLLWAHRNLTRDGHGVLRAQLASRSQSADGTWTYSFVIDETGLTTPPPAISSGMVQSICCEGCQGFAAEAFNQHEFGARIIPETDPLAADTYTVRQMIRPFLLQDVRAWVETPAATEDILIHVIVDGTVVTVNPIKIPGGTNVSEGSYTFQDGSKTHLIPEGARLRLQVAQTGPAAEGLEVWFFGHLNPSPYT